MARLGVGALLVALVGAGGIATVIPETAAAKSASAGTQSLLPTSVLSVRRVPAWLATTAATQRLDAVLQAVTGQALTAGSLPSGCLMVSQGDATLFSSNAQSMFIPASNLKILTATAVLDRLAQSDKFVTSVRSATPPSGGVVYGNLYRVGGGDPDLRTSAYGGGTEGSGTTITSLDKLAQQVRDSGVTEVTGSVIGDGSRYDSQRLVPSWKPIYTTEGDVGPLSALDVNDGFVPNTTTTTLPPPPQPRPPTPPPSTQPPSSQPPSSQPPSSQPATTQPPTTQPPSTQPAKPAPTTAPRETSNSAALAFAAATDPVAQAAQAFETLLRKDGVRVDGGARSGLAPAATTVVTSIDSAPLADEVDAMLSVSDDTAAELFTKELGYQESHQGTTAAGVAIIRQDLEADGLPMSQLVQVDGSGLDRGDRASCNLIVQALNRAGPTGTLAKGLPI
ncbi:MAG TPA: D-alanyl-D-alanine carboxypeptidase/D-alanyl-D-alanine-endopeptidase, partial [Acidimicrobiales bacterium]|nr:D-alanyl-D-alanine carboxypeptidase/D-alanyl-D-alanine-endopeptidase [Acidimicrobiales bacterium]